MRMAAACGAAATELPDVVPGRAVVGGVGVGVGVAVVVAVVVVVTVEGEAVGGGVVALKEIIRLRAEIDETIPSWPMEWGVQQPPA